MPLLLTKKHQQVKRLWGQRSSCPATLTLWLAVSITRFPKYTHYLGTGRACAASTAFTRATSSRGLNGFTT